MIKDKATIDKLKKLFDDKLTKLNVKDPKMATPEQVYVALCSAIREILSEKQRRHTAKTYGEGKKQVFYLSIEFLIGRSLVNNITNLGIEDGVNDILKKCGVSLEMITEIEPDAGLGNGGLGRLAACYLDALATENYSASGYSILYEFGIFRQKIIDGWQQEFPDNWMTNGMIWLEERRDEAVEVMFGGELEEIWDKSHHYVRYHKSETVKAIPYDLYVAGYDSKAVSKLRLWRAKAPEIDMESFNRGDYSSALKSMGNAELISKVLYPNDNFVEGKILRLRQQYFLCCATISDIISKHLAQYGSLDNFSDKVAIHINDTHPTLAIPELIRVLLDECGLSWERAFDIAKKTFSYTNHTVLSEALELWDIEIFKGQLPRIYQIICEINNALHGELNEKYPGDFGKISYMSILDKDNIRMANLCVYVCHTVNGVSALHSDIIKADLFNDFHNLYPKRFTNVTNGIAYRRWLLKSNPGLTNLLTELIGDKFQNDASHLKKLEKYKDDKNVYKSLMDIKTENKNRLLTFIGEQKYPINPESIFDVQAKRMHEYKRQHLNAINIIAEYLYLKNNPTAPFVPRTYIFGAKAAPGYYLAKQMIRFICGIGEMLEKDKAIRDKLRVLYLEDYRVTMSEVLMPATDISEQISLAGKEASGTGNMKFMLNGAVTLGTLDGANVEIRESAGAENFFLFGMTKNEVFELQGKGYDPLDFIKKSPVLKEVVDFIKAGFDGNDYEEIYKNLTGLDPYLVMADFDSYHNMQKTVASTYVQKDVFSKMSLMNIANSGVFSADRAVTEYADNIWYLKAVK